MEDLTAKQTEFFRSMEATFNTSGWTLLKQGWVEESAALSDRAFFNAKSMDDVQNARVRYGLLQELIALEDQIAAQKQSILDTADQDDLHV